MAHLPNIDHLVYRLEQKDLYEAVDEILGMPNDLIHWAKPAIPHLLRIASWSSLKAACRIGPESEEDFLLLLKLMSDSKGSAVASLVTLLETSGPHFENQIERIAGFLQHSHYRVRIAAARAMKGMDILLELVEQQLLRALTDSNPSVIEAVLETLKANGPHLTEQQLANAVSQDQIRLLAAEKRQIFDLLERQMWWPRTLKLNAASADENVIFIYRFKTDEEQLLDRLTLINQLLTSHGLPAHGEAFHEMSFEQFHWNLSDALKPVYFTEPCVEQPTIDLALTLKGLFSEDVILMGNHRYDKTGHIAYCGTVTSNIVDHGVICLDENHIGFFFVSDED